MAVSEGLLQRFNKDEIRAVLAHEVGHVANGDMVTLALIQGVVNTFVIFFARIVGHTVDRVVFKTERGHGIGYYVVTFMTEIVLAILASTIVAWFSRKREFRADHAGATLADRGSDDCGTTAPESGIRSSGAEPNARHAGCLRHLGRR